jgi:hypothetical protein
LPPVVVHCKAHLLRLPIEERQHIFILRHPNMPNLYSSCDG